MWFRRWGAMLMGAALLTTSVGCTAEDLAEIDQDGDGLISRVELITAVMNRLCPADDGADTGGET